MNNVEQIVEMYDDVEDAYEDMKGYIMSGWLVYACVSDGNKTVVVYERELGMLN